MKKAIAVHRVTLQDIAKATGYSINTVSHALRDKDDINENTKQKIRQVAEEMGYTGDKVASSLRSGRTRTFALILGSMSNPFYAIFTDIIQDAAQEKGYNVLILCSREQPELELELARNAISQRVDGILLFPTTDSAATIRLIQQVGIPFVLMTRSVNGIAADCIISDEKNGARMAVLHLIENGRRKLGYVVRQNIVYSYEQRLSGFISACDESGIPEKDRFFYLAAGKPEKIHTNDWVPPLLDQLISWKDQGVDGIFAFCDMEALGIQGLIRQTPALADWDVGIVGYDNIQGIQDYASQLCSVSWDFQTMAREAVRLLRARIKGSPLPPQTVVCKTTLICKHSC